ncbi:MAG: cell wall anchor protein [Paludibacter sp.]
MRKYILLFSLYFILSPITLLAQKITVTAKLDSTVLWIGAQEHLTFTVSQQPNQKVISPIFSDTIIGGLELVEPVKNDTVKSPDGPILVTQRYLVTAFQDSLMYIPPFPFVLNGDTVWSKSLSLKVVQPFKIDTAANSIADIKPVFEPKFDWVGLIKIILLVLIIIALLVFLYFILRKYWLKKPIFEPTPEIVLPPYLIALNHLDKIKQEKPWQQNRIKEYHTELVDVIREYIEQTFDINCMEMTSIEILEHLGDLRKEQKSAYLALKQMLQLADLVKFAKWNPTPDEHESSLTNAYSFVNQTKVEEAKPLEVVPEEKPTIK